MSEQNQPDVAMIHVAPDTDSKVIALYGEGVKLQQYALARIVASDDDARTATDDLALIAKLKKAIEEQRQGYVGPINIHLKTINEAFKNFTAPLAEADTLTRSKILAYRQEQARVKAEQERINRLREEAAKAEMALKGELSEPVAIVPVAQAPAVAYHADGGTTGTAKVWKFEVEDLDKLPREYMVPDLVKIGKVVRAGVAVPGVKAWQEEMLRVTTR